MKNLKRFMIPLVICMILSAATLSGTVMADNNAVQDSCGSAETSDAVYLAAHSSYVTETYFAVNRVKVGDNSIATATIDSKNRIVITGIGQGSTTVTYWYTYSFSSDDDDWIQVTVPVIVAGEAGSYASGSAKSITFPESVISVTKGVTQSFDDMSILENENNISPSELFWFSPSSEVITVDSNTGTFTAKNVGTAVIYVISRDGKYSGSVTVTVRS